MLVNAMEHGGHFDPMQTVDVSIMRTNRSLIYAVGDPGSGFSLDELSHAAVSYPEDERSLHML